jgi:broad specificity phosphatase PhoE
LQTIEPYIKKYGCQIKIEYALQEHLRTVAFDVRNYNRVSGKEWADYFNIDLTYVSNCGKIVALETSEDVANRIENFINYIVGMYKETSENILIATHQVIVHYIMSMFGKGIPEHGVGMGDIIEISL